MEGIRSLRALIPIACLLLSAVVLVNIAVISGNVSSTSNLREAPLSGQYDVEYPNIFSEESSPLLPPKQVQKKQRLPSSLIIGVRKGGTRALLDALAVHPQIRVARHEVHFFNNNDTYAKGEQWYRSQMPFTYAEQVTIEKTPAYFTNKFAAERAKRMNSSLKLILILRNPIIRTISDFTQVMCTKMERNKTQPNFESAAFLSDGLTINVDYKPIRNSLYALHMARWLSYFPLENFLIIDGDKFIFNPLPELRKVEKFLQLASLIDEDQVVYNKQKGFYCFRRKDRIQAKCLGNSKGRVHANISSQTQQLLFENFRPFNEKFFKMINRRFFWE